MKFKSTIGQYNSFTDVHREEQIAAQFSYIPPTTPITVDTVSMDIKDEYNGFIEIMMSNADRIVYDLYEPQRPKYPGDCNFSLTVNGRVLTKKLEDITTIGSSLLDSILKFYIKNYLQV